MQQDGSTPRCNAFVVYAPANAAHIQHQVVVLKPQPLTCGSLVSAASGFGVGASTPLAGQLRSQTSGRRHLAAQVVDENRDEVAPACSESAANVNANTGRKRHGRGNTPVCVLGALFGGLQQELHVTVEWENLRDADAVRITAHSSRDEDRWHVLGAYRHHELLQHRSAVARERASGEPQRPASEHGSSVPTDQAWGCVADCARLKLKFCCRMRCDARYCDSETKTYEHAWRAPSAQPRGAREARDNPKAA